MLDLSIPKILVLLVLALVVLGPERLPDAARSVGRLLGEVRKVRSNLDTEIRNTFSGFNPMGDAAGPSAATGANTDWKSFRPTANQHAPAPPADSVGPVTAAPAEPSPVDGPSFL